VTTPRSARQIGPATARGPVAAETLTPQLLEENALLCSQLLRQLEQQQPPPPQGPPVRQALRGPWPHTSASSTADAAAPSRSSSRAGSARGGHSSARRGRDESVESGLTEVDALLADLDRHFDLQLAGAGGGGEVVAPRAAVTKVAVPPTGAAPVARRPAPPQEAPKPPGSGGYAANPAPPPQAAAPLPSGGRRPGEELRPGQPLQTPRKANLAAPLPPLAPHAEAVAAAQAAVGLAAAASASGGEAQEAAVAAGAGPAEEATASSASAALLLSIGGGQVEEVDVEVVGLQHLREEVERERQRYIAERLAASSSDDSSARRPGSAPLPPWDPAYRPSSSNSKMTLSTAATTPTAEEAAQKTPTADQLRDQVRKERELFLESCSN